MRAILASAAALLLSISGCTGGAPKTTVNKPITNPVGTHRRNEPPKTAPIEAPSTAAASVDEPIANAGSQPPAPPDANSKAPPTNSLPKHREFLPAPTVLPAEMPEVILSAAHADECLIRAGDKLPDFRLPDIMGRMRSLKDVRGNSLTVVVFWSGDRLVASDQLRYLDMHIARYADLGIKAVAINVGETPRRVQATVDKLALATPVLLDIDRSLFSRIGTNRLPRTYLLDGEGTVIWFDIEFSRQTREGLQQAIHASLQST